MSNILTDKSFQRLKFFAYESSRKKRLDKILNGVSNKELEKVEEKKCLSRKRSQEYWSW